MDRPRGALDTRRAVTRETGAQRHDRRSALMAEVAKLGARKEWLFKQLKGYKREPGADHERRLFLRQLHDLKQRLDEISAELGRR